ncbi:MAG: twin-arginine translocase TatA/TatE family subunit [Bacteroides sp.]|nr:twin-arginine translocase TatA/TatE family subunit [Bacteroides sp.]
MNYSKNNRYDKLTFFLGNFGGAEVLIIAIMILLLFGGKKIPELMKGLGKWIKSFKQSMNEIEEDIMRDDNKL